MNIYTVILAGGAGTRFWPLSRQKKPKQLINLSGQDIMLNETIKRSDNFIKISNTFIVTTSDLKKATQESLMSEFPEENILLEPMARNTSACILYASMHILDKFGDGIICVMPSDHHISDSFDSFSYENSIKKAVRIANDYDRLVTLGMKAKFAQTGYGYIKKSGELIEENAYIIESFTEKPNYKKAMEYIKSENYFWNSGIFVFKASVIINEFKRFLPKTYKKFEKIRDSLFEPNVLEILASIYNGLEDISFDFAIMERIDEAIVIPCDFEWSDIGNWNALANIFPPDNNNNIIKSDHIGIDTAESVIYGEGKLIATIGLSNMIIVDTPDALLICNKNNSQDIKLLVQELKDRNRLELL